MEGKECKNLEKETVSICPAAKLLGFNQQSVRERIRAGIWNFGEVIPKKKTGRKTDSFVIYRRKLYKHLGIEGDQHGSDNEIETKKE